MKIIERVRYDRYALLHIQNQSPEICIAAVQIFPYALEYVKDQTTQICIAAVQKDGYALKYVHQQTPEICIAAVQQYGSSLKYVKDKTPEICMAAVQQFTYALKYVYNQTSEICMTAVKKYGISCVLIKSELFDYDEYVYMMYVAIYKSQIFCDSLEIDTIENKIDYLKKCCKQITDELIDDIIAIKCKSIKRAA